MLFDLSKDPQGQYCVNINTNILSSFSLNTELSSISLLKEGKDTDEMYRPLGLEGLETLS